MVGNAVPPRLAKFLALAIKESLNTNRVRGVKPVNVLVAIDHRHIVAFEVVVEMLLEND